MVAAPLGFLPVFPNRLFFIWLLMFQGILTFQQPSYFGVWSICLFLDFFYDIPIGVTFLSFAIIYLGLDWAFKYLIGVSFFILWGIVIVVVIGLDALFFRGGAWRMLMHSESWVRLGIAVGFYPLITWVCRKIRESKIFTTSKN
jgi:hypothetical protein